MLCEEWICHHMPVLNECNLNFGVFKCIGAKVSTLAFSIPWSSSINLTTTCMHCLILHIVMFVESIVTGLSTQNTTTLILFQKPSLPSIIIQLVADWQWSHCFLPLNLPHNPSMGLLAAEVQVCLLSVHHLHWMMACYHGGPVKTVWIWIVIGTHVFFDHFRCSNWCPND